MTRGERIKQCRERVGMGQTELAEKIGTSKQNLYKYENDIITNIPSDIIEKIAAALDCTPQYLMGWTDSQYYDNDDAAELADFLLKNPKYKVLFDASRKVPAKDIDFVRQMIERMSNNDD